MSKQPDISVSDVTRSFVQIILGDAYVKQNPALSSFERVKNDRVLVLAALILVMTLGWPAFGPPIRAKYEVDPSYVHLGDNVYNQDFCRGILGDKIINPFPSDLVYANIFNTHLIRSRHNISRDVELVGAELKLYANEVDSISPVTVSVNGTAVGYLNQFFMPDDSCRRRLVRMPIPMSLLYTGDNIIVIEVGPKAVQTSYSDYEDMEFDHLGVDLLFRRELSLETVSRYRIAIIGIGASVFVLVFLGPIVYKKFFVSDVWRSFAVVLLISCAVATILVPF